MLRDADRAVLDDLGRPFRVEPDGAFVAVIVEHFPLPSGLSEPASDLLIRLPPGFPDAGPDMFWLHPGVRGPDDTQIPGTESNEPFQDRIWQRWSRHLGTQWRPGIDNLGTYLAYVRRCLDHAAGRAA